MEQGWNSTSFLPYSFFPFSSFANPQEVKLVIEIMKLIKQKKKQSGIITPYNAQKKRILKELEKAFGATR